MNNVELSNLYEIAARARIHQRCALAYLHDVRGSMQALFSAVELLGRSVRSAAANPERVEKAWDLAKRAISHHETFTLGALQTLTLLRTDPTSVEVGQSLSEVVHFLRLEAANKEVALKVTMTEAVTVTAEQAKFQTLLIGLLLVVIDATPFGTELPLAVRRDGRTAVVSMGSDGRCSAYPGSSSAPETDPSGNDLTLVFARDFLATHGGRLEMDPAQRPAALRILYPVAD